MQNRRLISLMALLFAAGLSLSACGGDSNSGNNGTNNADTGNDSGMADAGTDGGNAGTDGGMADAGTDGGTTSGCSTNDDCGAGQMCDTSTSQCVEAPTGCDLTGSDRPARCDKTSADTTWGPGSIFTSFQVDGDSDNLCCFDYTGDGTNNNILGTTLDSFDQLASINQSIADNIDNGTLMLSLEHDGLTAIPSTDSYGLNLWLGQSVDSNGAITINPTSVDQGTYPQAHVNNAEIGSDGSFTAGPGTVNITVSLLNTPLTLVISEAQLSGTVDMDKSSIADGVFINDGKLGGVVRSKDVLDAVNGYASTCDCLGLGSDKLITYDESDVNGTVACTPLDNDTCDSNSTCEKVGSSCMLISSVPALADVDTNNDGTPDALSIGARFTTDGATFSGIGTAQ